MRACMARYKKLSVSRRSGATAEFYSPLQRGTQNGAVKPFRQPCILATPIPVSVGQLVVIWLLRTLLGILLAALCGRLALALGWLG